MKKGTFAYHIIFWVALYLLWILLFRSYSVALSKTMTIEFCYLLFITADFYLIDNLLIPRFLIKKKYAYLVLATMLTIALSAWLRTLVAMQVNTHFFHSLHIAGFRELFINSVFNISLWVLVITIGKMLIDRAQNQQQLELLQNEKTKSELDYLKAQINPHALFNSLNTIYGNIDKGNQAARNILLQFAELLRYQLYDCSEEEVRLEKEIGFIQKYIVFQQLRKDDKLTVKVDIENYKGSLNIAPLLIIVLIENAFKFVGSQSENGNEICIQLFTRGAKLTTTIINTIDVQASATDAGSKGIGIGNLKRRLELLYPGKYEFTNKRDSCHYETNLNLELA